MTEAKPNCVIIDSISLSEPPFFLINGEGEYLTTITHTENRSLVLAFTTKDKAEVFATEAGKDGKHCKPLQHDDFKQVERFLCDHLLEFTGVCFNYRTDSEQCKSVDFVIAKIKEYRRSNDTKRVTEVKAD